jgi:prophage regulatory protein
MSATKKSKPQKPWLKATALRAPAREKPQPPAEVAKRFDIPRLLNRPEVCAIAGVTYPTVWAMMQDGSFPRSRVIGGKTRWLSTEVEQWVRDLPVRQLLIDKSPEAYQRSKQRHVENERRRRASLKGGAS